MHNAVDDCSRPADTEILTDEKKETAAGFCLRANAYFEARGITVKRVLTDNGSCYVAKSFRRLLAKLRTPMDVGGHELVVSASIGISGVPSRHLR